MGGALLDEVLTRADDANAPAYLESSNKRNLPLYQRHGFEIVEEVRLLGRGPPSGGCGATPRAGRR